MIIRNEGSIHRSISDVLYVLYRKNRKDRNRGTTLVEIIVSFALLAIFMACTATIISSITGMYYNVRCETYSKQVSDIVLEKIASEIEGAKYSKVTTGINPVITEDSITFYDRTDTKITLSADDMGLSIYYHGFRDLSNDITRQPSTWRFDEKTYNGFSVVGLNFVRGDELSTSEFVENNAALYNLDTDHVNYGKDVVVVFLHLKSPKYGDYYFTRVVKMYYYLEVPDDPEQTG